MFSLNNLTTFLRLLKISMFKYVPFYTMYTTPICICSYKESTNSLNANICISKASLVTILMYVCLGKKSALNVPNFAITLDKSTVENFLIEKERRN